MFLLFVVCVGTSLIIFWHSQCLTLFLFTFSHSADGKERKESSKSGEEVLGLQVLLFHELKLNVLQ